MTVIDKHYTQALYLDLEWTCWNTTPPPGMQEEIIEIGVVALDLSKLKILDETSYFVRPRLWEISEKCTKLTGITDEDIRGARPLAEVLAKLVKRFQPQGRPCCTWGDDVSILSRKCKSVGLVSPFGRPIDLCKVFQGAFATKEYVGLRAATQILGIKFDGFAHGALSDAKNTALIHASILWRLRREPEPIDQPSVAKDAVDSIGLFAQS